MPENSQVLYNRPLFGARLNMSHHLSKGLVGCWLFNDNGGIRAWDSGPYGQHGSLLGFAAPVKRPFNGLPFDGAANYIDCGSDTRIRNFDALTIIMWTKTAQSAAVRDLLDSGYANVQGYRIYYEENNRNVNMFLRNGVENSMLTVTYQDNVWTQVGIKWDGTSLWPILNGAVGTSTPHAGAVAAANNVTVARRADFSSNFWDGTIAQLLLYNRNISDDEVKALYLTPYVMFG